MGAFLDRLFMKRRALFFSLILFSLFTQVITLLHKPDPSISDSSFEFCNYYINKFRILNVHIDCDAQYFLLDAQNPMRILNDQSPIQDRPLHAVLVYLIAKILTLVGMPEFPITYLGEDGIPQTYNLLHYTIYIGLNAVILFISVILVLRVLVLVSNKKDSTKGFTLPIILTVGILVQNPITFEFFWTAHSQIFNILIPALIFYFLHEDFIFTKSKLWGTVLLLSILLLMYPTFFIVLPVIYLKAMQQLGKKTIPIVTLAVLPKILWPGMLGLLGGNYNDTPVEGHRRFIWIIDSLKDNTFPSTLLNKLDLFIHSIPLLWVLILLAYIAIGVWASKSNTVLLTGVSNRYLKNSFIAFSIYFLGIALNGEYGPRFTIGVLILLALLITKEALRVGTPRNFTLLYSLILGINLVSWIF